MYDDDEDVERIELTVIHKKAIPDVWTRLGLWPDEDDDEDYDSYDYEREI